MSKHYTKLSLNERTQIQTLYDQCITVRVIARTVMRAPSTISRELARNRHRPAQRGSQSNVDTVACYIAAQAQTLSDARRAKAKAAVRRIPPSWDTPLAKFVRNDLAHGWSPAQVAGRLKLAYPNDPTMHASAETIYSSIYIVPRGALRTELIAQLRRAHDKRLPRARGEARGKPRKSTIVNAIPISERPDAVGERLTSGHWEGDFIKGAYNRSAIGTLIERQSRLALLSAVGGCTAQHALDGFTKRLLTIPSPLRLTLTYDNGSEMAMHEQLAANLDIEVFFCEPYSPWQRGSNENMNGLVRQYLPKGMDLSTVTPQRLRYIEDSLNNRPRKILNFRTPREAFYALESGLTFEQAINIDILAKGVALHA
jgi:transposase, IS30 family